MPFEFLPHTADVRMNVSGKSLEELFCDALRGTMQFLSPNAQENAARVQHTIEISSPDVTALLVDFLNAALSSAQENKETYADVTIKDLAATHVSATVSGYPVQSFGNDIKAVTYHEADVHKNEKGEWKTTIVFDI